MDFVARHDLAASERLRVAVTTVSRPPHLLITIESLEQLLEVIRDWTERERAEAAKQSFGPTSVLSEAESIECVVLLARDGTTLHVTFSMPFDCMPFGTSRSSAFLTRDIA